MDNISPQAQSALEIIKKTIDQEEFSPSRISVVNNGGVNVSWSGNGKYTEMQVSKDGSVTMCLAYEVGTPKFYYVALFADDAYEFDIRRGISMMQEFIG